MKKTSRLILALFVEDSGHLNEIQLGIYYNGFKTIFISINTFFKSAKIIKLISLVNIKPKLTII